MLDTQRAGVPGAQMTFGYKAGDGLARYLKKFSSRLKIDWRAPSVVRTTLQTA